MKSRNVALTITIDEWLKMYDEDKEDATFALVNFIVQSCGSIATITRDEFDTFEPNDDIKAILRRLTEETGLEAVRTCLTRVKIVCLPSSLRRKEESTLLCPVNKP